jgi:hypothetical protein
MPRRTTAARARRVLTAALWATTAAATAGCTAEPPAPVDRPAAPPPTTAPAAGRDDIGPGSPRSSPRQVLATRLAARFARAWVRRDLTAEQWWAAITPMCSAGLARLLRGTDPGNIPAGDVTGPARRRSGGPSPVYEIATDGGDLIVTITATVDGWRVTNIDFHRRVT